MYGNIYPATRKKGTDKMVEVTKTTLVINDQEKDIINAFLNVVKEFHNTKTCNLIECDECPFRTLCGEDCGKDADSLIAHINKLRAEAE